MGETNEESDAVIICCMNRRLAGLMIILVLIPVFGIAYLLSTPRVEQISPLPDAADVNAGETLRMTFSRQMDPETVIDRLTISPAVSGSYTWDGNTLIFEPDEPWPNGETVRVQLRAGARTQSWPRLTIQEDASWSFQIGYPRLAFLYPSNAAAQIYILDPQTGESVAVTGTAAGVLEYQVDPSGQRIYFSANNGMGGSDLFRLDGIRSVFEDTDAAEGEAASLPEPVRLLSCQQDECRFPAVSPTGKYLAFERTGFTASEHPAFPRVWLLPLQEDGTAGEPELAGEENHQTLAPSWSPAGMLVYYDSHETAFVIQDPQSGEQFVFPNQTGQPGDWTASGDAYLAPDVTMVIPKDLQPGQSGQETLANSRLIRFTWADEQMDDLSQSEEVEDSFPAYSPDGSRIAFSRRYLDPTRWAPGRQLWIMDAGGGAAQPLTNDPNYTHYDFEWSPQGDQIAFVRFDQTILSDPPEVWVINTQTTQAERLVPGGYSPQWIP